MPKPKQKDTPAEQSARFRDAAKKLGVDTNKFERAFKKIVKAQVSSNRALVKRGKAAGRQKDT